MALPPARQLGANVVENAGLESGTAGWFVPRCWTLDSAVSIPARIRCATMRVFFAEVLHRLRILFSRAGRLTPSACGQNPRRAAIFRRELGVFNDTAGTLPVASSNPTAVGSDWIHIVLPHVDLLPLHKGDELRTRLMSVSAPTGQTPSWDVLVRRRYSPT